MATSTTVANLVLGHLGQGKPISDLDTDRSKEAQAIRLYWDTAVEEILRDFPWPFATKMVALSLVEENPLEDEDLTNRYTYSYRYPSDCLFFREIINGHTNSPRYARIHYKIIYDAQGKLILTNTEEACGEYTSTDGTDPALWSSDFILAVSFRLACYVAPLIIGNNHQVVSERVLFFWNMSNKKAKANAANEEQPENDPDGEMILARI